MSYYALATWHVRPGAEDAFEEAWTEMRAVLAEVPGLPVTDSVLVRNVTDPSRYCSFGPWPDTESLESMQSDPAVRSALAAARACCVQASPGTFEVRRVLA